MIALIIIAKILNAAIGTKVSDFLLIWIVTYSIGESYDKYFNSKTNA